jgi:hypothetical protein
VPERKRLAEASQGVVSLDKALEKAAASLLAGESASGSESKQDADKKEGSSQRSSSVHVDGMNRTKRVMHEMRQLFKVHICMAVLSYLRYFGALLLHTLYFSLHFYCTHAHSISIAHLIFVAHSLCRHGPFLLNSTLTQSVSITHIIIDNDLCLTVAAPGL